MWYLIGALIAAWIGYEIYAVRKHGRPVLRGILDGLGGDIRAVAHFIYDTLTDLRGTGEH